MSAASYDIFRRKQLHAVLFGDFTVHNGLEIKLTCSVYYFFGLISLQNAEKEKCPFRP